MFDKSWYNLLIAIEAIWSNKTRSILTGLGIIFGVAAVIIMLAIGNGSKKEILEQIKLVGSNNIIIEGLMPEDEGDGSGSGQGKETKKYAPGLTLADARSIMKIPTVEAVCPEVGYRVNAIATGKNYASKLIGVTPEYFKVYNIQLSEGSMFSWQHIEQAKPVCILGAKIAGRLFPEGNPIGKRVKCNNIWFKVIGVIKPMEIEGTSIESMGVNTYNNEVYAPIQTVLLRYKNRTLVTNKTIESAAFSDDEEENTPKPPVNNNQLDKIVVQVRETNKVLATFEVLNRQLLRRHMGAENYSIQIPEHQLKQSQDTKERFNALLAAIASISLLVGGIGIMNIMLASVLERIKEIGVRLSMGATKKDIQQQFMYEALLISLAGGVIGIIVGVVTSLLLPYIFNSPTVISAMPIIISFVVSASVGVIFGYTPAKRASEQDPINSLRYE